MPANKSASNWRGSIAGDWNREGFNVGAEEALVVVQEWKDYTAQANVWTAALSTAIDVDTSIVFPYPIIPEFSLSGLGLVNPLTVTVTGKDGYGDQVTSVSNIDTTAVTVWSGGWMFKEITHIKTSAPIPGRTLRVSQTYILGLRYPTLPNNAGTNPQGSALRAIWTPTGATAYEELTFGAPGLGVIQMNQNDAYDSVAGGWNYGWVDGSGAFVAAPGGLKHFVLYYGASRVNAR